TKDFPRLRFGIGRPPQGVSTVGHVLQRFAEAEARVLPERLEEAVEVIEAFVAIGVESTMNRVRRGARPTD
ncbi:MAG: aminoacyl-tRNA hydrolase, partial [bacterium]|nr:aminoacyl-tRNA hydrolase [bacterium]